ncbi:hypothetical protein [Paralysiella testudinis]|uniref:Uncharacterized protein n=1 Tax=Paralysiella testudinis TaxID=2809020 RepID=A0A892ZH46_9NEIS|nr:hypothetical protein [Paralysiella testudinis]QRQ82845.1 hypothetical protein JQU52_05550 [Paralysiella testudinis]
MQNNQIPANEMANVMQQIHVLMAKYYPGRVFDPHEIQQQQPRFEAVFF